MAINHEKPDRVPRGEFYVEEVFLNRFLPRYAKASYGEKLRLLIEELRLDLVTIRVDDQEEEEGLREIEKWASQTNYFVMASIDGLFWRPKDELPFEEFLVGLVLAPTQDVRVLRCSSVIIFSAGFHMLPFITQRLIIVKILLQHYTSRPRGCVLSTKFVDFDNIKINLTGLIEFY